jgi:hypothetical protein
VRYFLAIASAAALIALGAAGWYLTSSPAPRPEAPVETPAASTRPAASAPVAPTIEAPAPARPTASRPAVTAATPAPVVEAPAAAPTTGSLRIETDVPGATVFFDRIGVGTAPMTIPNITPGSHRLNVSASGYDGYGETIDVEPGERVITINFKEIKLDARLNAVHKHGVGSCRGVLTATPQAIVYTAADGKDTFTIGLTQITTFEVDYLAKNLRIRGPQGRTYNFGDPDDNADRLFVFHRDVDKARQRVLSGQ